MKNICLSLLLLWGITAFSQRARDTIASEQLKADRTFTVSLPLSYGKEKNKKYPLLVLLDGDYLFDAFNGAMSYANYWDDLPEMIIVGIDQNGTREDDSMMDDEGLPEEQGAHFFDFIATELMPALQKKYRVAPFKIIAGHDVTAGFLNLFLYKEDPLFDAYIAMSPEFGEQMLERIPTRLQVIKKPIFYYLSGADGDLKENMKVVHDLNQNMGTVKNSSLYYNYDEFKGATHYSMVLYSIPNALYHIFSAYQPISTDEFNTKIVTLPSDYVGYLTKKYDIIEKSYGMKMPVRLTDFKAIEAAILKNNAFSEFEKLSAIAKKNYPKSMLGNYELAMFYEKTGDPKKAAKAYMSAYLMDEIGDLTKDMMLDKADEMKKGSAKKPKEIQETPTETPTEEKKP
ncbi:MAG: alpha/beta hydrolase-fold protein [Flavobacterium sp.]|nr:alpha/beta hydrolase-fold protein [Flavobacterium sp.]